MKIKFPDAVNMLMYGDEKQLISALGYEYHGIKNNYQALCHDDRSPSLSFKRDTDGKLVCRCHRCAAMSSYQGYSNCIQHYMDIHNIQDFKEGVKAYAAELGYQVEESDSKLPPKYLCLCRANKAIAELASAYYGILKDKFFEDRGLIPEIIKEYQLGLIPFNDKLDLFERVSAEVIKDCSFTYEFVAATLVEYGVFKSTSKGYKFPLQGLYLIPIKNKGGAIVGFAGRIPPGSTGSKYINSVDSEYFHKGNILWNYNQHKTSTKMYVLEGYFDVLTAEMAGVPAVAVMSAGLTPKGAELLDGKEVILCLDNDATGQQSMENLILRYPRYQVLDMSTVPYKDWNDTLMSEGLDKVKDLFNTLPVLSGPEWLLNRRLKSIDLSSSLEKRKLFKEISALADKIGGLEGLYFQAVAWFKILGLDNPTEEAVKSFLDYKTKNK